MEFHLTEQIYAYVYWVSVVISFFCFVVYDDIKLSQKDYDYFFIHYRTDKLLNLLIYVVFIFASLLLGFFLPFIIIFGGPIILFIVLAKKLSKFLQITILKKVE